MHIEVQVALNFVISYLYNKLPRRRVNIFGEELEKALKDKFKGHWYPEKPFKGSAFRCLKTGDPVDPVLERAAKESGVPIQDILENLPAELAVWVDPGEVSYRIGEMNAVKILYSETGDPHDESSADREVTKTFNPEAQCFRPIEAVGTSLGGLSLSPKSTSPFPTSLASSNSSSNGSSNNQQNSHGSGSSSAPSPTPIGNSFKGSPSPVPNFIPRTTAPLTFTTATFAQTKFGSTKLKTSSKRANRMSPTEFSNYIKQRAMQQQIHHHHHHQQHQQQQAAAAAAAAAQQQQQQQQAAAAAAAQQQQQQVQQQAQQQQQQQQGSTSGSGGGVLPVVSQSSPNNRSLSPGSIVGAGGAGSQQHTDPSAYFFQHGPAAATAAYHPQFSHRNIFDSSSHGGYLPSDLYAGAAKFPSSYLDPGTIAGYQFYGGSVNGTGTGTTGAGTNGATSNGILAGATGNAGANAQNSANLGPVGSGATPSTGTVNVAAAAAAAAAAQQQPDKNALVEGLNNFGLGSVAPYPASQYQHLLVAN
ncbi:PREDICTED: protein Tob1 [Polistes canadensis]|uniref:protein Tob1 n=1 Tax=Polistes canadensis TaxID=91411 RepID=UPI000718F7E6|nr:PREDICTED: protein Tob1 [Polistes canadensis]XP_014606735.1 PREDICTED: protein Tob1 [Polistes canadensis]XP_014606736.1 PREDICTED: protein Tob1 [Polistes canadensis]XP_014606737.1 PREDICTED: protein Tob1 [Polistes canadensis]XP_014606738.1 PREDICTED: protein Tob1 [Polistes canadensis]XP_014606739.1 PREDICTED: protein Tob1 [Polistes canadensis]XP_014606740.1 PREDICTED: protein Tob1 [Polistes canadensis]